MKSMTPAAKLVFIALQGKYKYFSERRMLATDGSFYCIDKNLKDYLGLGDNTIQRARIYLKTAGRIDYQIGKHKGSPTRYWILLKDTRLGCFDNLRKNAKMGPFGPDAKGANLALKGANPVLKASQNGTLNIKEVIKHEINNTPENFSFTEEQKKDIRAWARVNGVAKTSSFLVDKGFDPQVVKEMLEGVVINA